MTSEESSLLTDCHVELDLDIEKRELNLYQCRIQL